VQCLRIGLGGTQVLSMDQCPVADIPSASEPCNTLACPSAWIQIVAPPAISACSGAVCANQSGSSGNDAIPLQILCRSSVG